MPSRLRRNTVGQLFAHAALSAVLTACGGGGAAPLTVSSGSPPSAPPPPPPALTQFVPATLGSGMYFDIGYRLPLHPTPLNKITGGGAVAAGDYDNDGDVDIFIVRGDIGPNLLYRNTGNMIFEDVAAAAGIAYTKSATENYRHAAPMFADLDGDGLLDLFIGGLNRDPCMIFINNGDGSFFDATQGAGFESMITGHTISAAFGDYDLDGDLDLLLAHWGTRVDDLAPGDTEHLWRNDSDATGIRFTSVSVDAGISPSIINLPDPLTTDDGSDFTFAPSFARINDDLYPDILSVADFNYTKYFVNNQDGTFSNATDVDVLIDENGMGSAVGDYDNDGDLDWFVSSIMHDGTNARYGNRLYRNEDGVFTDVTDETGVADGQWGWGACFLDIENDGDLDIYHTNGWQLSNETNNYEIDESRVFVSDGAGHFEERAEELGLNDSHQGRGIVCADFDNDGDIDILQLRTSGPSLWRNDATGNNFLIVKLRGVAPNTGAIGSRVLATVGSVTQMREVGLNSNFMSQNPPEQIFGLGSETMVTELKVQWNDGRETVMPNVTVNQRLTISHPDL